MGRRKVSNSDSTVGNSAAETLQHLLQSRFGWDRLLPAQERIITRVMAGQNVLGVLPTGGGKSLCYQLPSQFLPGITLVVSPLIALMKDQCDVLAAKGIPAARWDASVDAATERRQWSQLRDGSCKLLYVAPERLFNERFATAIGSLAISLLAIDEAHCISQWGHQFRPDYRRLPELVTRWSIPQTLALTATASRDVVKQIRMALNIGCGNTVVTPLVRPNLHLRCIDASADDREQLLLERLKSRRPGPTIVYVTRRRDAESIAGSLLAAGLSVAAYHAGLDRSQRDAVQSDFLTGATRIVVATIAFGMGIDKADVRYIYHVGLSSSLEAYSQEIGRAGRDGRAAICETLLIPSDRTAIENVAYTDLPTLDSLCQMLERIGGQSETFAISHTKLGWETNLAASTVAAALMSLQEGGHVESLSMRYDQILLTCHVASETMLARADDAWRDRVGIIVDSLAKAKRGHRLNLTSASRRHEVDRDALMQTLDEMAVRGWVSVKFGDPMHRYRWKRPLASVKKFAKRFQTDQLRLIEASGQRVDRVLNLLRCNECLTIQLASHFGTLRRRPCGKCTTCLGEGPIETTVRSAVNIGTSARESLRRAMRKKPECFGDPIDRAKFLCGLYTSATKQHRLNHLAGFAACEDVPFATVLAQVTELAI